MTSDLTLLLVDDHHVLYRPGTERRLHPLSRHKDNPVVRDREKPWEVAIGWCSAHRDPDTGRYRLWYQAFSGHHAHEKTHRCVNCYAESSDGVNWSKPNLGIYRYNDVEETNIVLLANGGRSDRYSASVVVDLQDPDPARRYKMAYFDFSMDEGREYPGLSVAFSPDGVHWNKHPKAPLLRASYGRLGQPLPYQGESGREWSIPLSFSDAMDAFRDPTTGSFVMYHKMWLDAPDGTMYWKHGMGRTESEDFIHWSRPQLVLAPDEFDPPWVEFHHSPVFFYNGCYFALLQILNRGERGGIMAVELALSRDGVHWQRPFRSPFFIPRSDGNQFDSGSILSNGTPIMLDDEFRFYYGGYSQGATGASDYDLITGVGLATMQRDRFASVRPIEGRGQITLKPVDLAGCNAITLNADARSGSVSVELLDFEGRLVAGYAGDDIVPVTGDSLRHPVRWREKDLAQLPAGQYMLRLHLEDAEVFALTLQG